MPFNPSSVVGSCRLRDWSTESSLTLNTDNRLVSNTNMPKELGLAASTFDLTPKQMKDIVLGGFKRSFFPVCLRRTPCYPIPPSGWLYSTSPSPRVSARPPPTHHHRSSRMCRSAPTSAVSSTTTKSWRRSTAWTCQATAHASTAWSTRLTSPPCEPEFVCG